MYHGKNGKEEIITSDMKGAAAGYFLENYVVIEMIKNASYGEREMNLNFYRDKNQKKIDLIVIPENCMKCAKTAHKYAVKA